MYNNPNSEIFKYCPSCGSSNLEISSEKSFSCPQCNFNFYINSASATVAVIIYDNKLLCGVRKFDPAKGTLDLPGGFVENNESTENALIREVKEETNLDIIRMRYLFSIPNIYLYRNVTYHSTDCVFLCEVSDFENLKPADDIEKIVLINLNELNSELFGLSSIKTIVKKIIETNGKFV